MLNYENYLSSSPAIQRTTEEPKPFFQPKLTINPPGDVYEQEADAMADRVMRMPEENEQAFFKPNPISDTPLSRKENSPLNLGTNSFASSSRRWLLSNDMPLPESTRRFFEPKFGQDFSHVKIHAGEEANRSAKSVQALAYTYGNNIVFNANQYHPDTLSGKKLLAHELTHVVQQSKAGKSQSIQRSFWGTVAGAIGGAAVGFLVGGPAGAIAGGIIGGIGGDAVTTHKRALNQVEIGEAQKLFANTLDYSKVKVSDTSALMSIGGYARTPFDTIYFPSGTLNRNDKAYFAFLIHELTHTWQSQHGTSVFTKIRYSLSSDNYDFGGDAGLEEAANAGKCFNDFNTEAQASILETYYKIREGISSGDVAIYEYFLYQVRYHAGRCKVLTPGLKTDLLDEKYRNKNDSDLSTT